MALMILQRLSLLLQLGMHLRTMVMALAIAYMFLAMMVTLHLLSGLTLRTQQVEFLASIQTHVASLTMLISHSLIQHTQRILGLQLQVTNLQLKRFENRSFERFFFCLKIYKIANKNSLPLCKW